MKSGKVRESRLWAWLSTTKRLFKKQLHLNRIENGVMEGMADTEGCLHGRQFWIELKCEARPSNPGTKIRLRFEPAQLPWLNRRIDAGGRAFVLIQVGRGAAARRYLITADRKALEHGMLEAAMKRYAAVDPKATAADIIRIASEYEF